MIKDLVGKPYYSAVDLLAENDFQFSRFSGVKEDTIEFIKVVKDEVICSATLTI